MSITPATLSFIALIALVILALVFKNRLRALELRFPWFEGKIEAHATKGLNSGGRGGDAKVSGKNSVAIGGNGGRGGPGGRGGDGGSVEAGGDNVFAMGGEGGEAGQIERGGKGGRGPLHVLMEDYPDKWKEIAKTFGITQEEAKEIGKGGDGGIC